MWILGATASSTLETIDLDQDGDLETVIRAPNGDPGSVMDAGALVVFDAPDTTSTHRVLPQLLTASPPFGNGYLGYDLGQNFQFADVTGDGITDVVGVARDRGGAILIWHGPISGHPSASADATLRCSDPDSGLWESMWNGNVAQPVVLEDVTNDGTLDIVAAFPEADTTFQGAGEVCVWAGGSGLAGTPAPTAILRRRNPGKWDRLGFTGTTQSLWFGDVSGDGVRDIVVGATQVYEGSNNNAGRIFVWKGGASLVGTPVPLATLRVANAPQWAGLHPVRVEDVTGDGTPDVVGMGGGFTDVWAGGSSMSGLIDPTFRVAGTGKVSCFDLTLDGVADLLISDSWATVSGVVGAGAIYLLAGGAYVGTVSPTATLALTAPTAWDQLGDVNDGVQIVDVTADGKPDVVVVLPSFDGAATNSGAVLLWTNNGTWSGSMPPTAVLQVPSASPGDGLGSYNFSLWNWPPMPTTMVLDDVTGDGIPDILAIASKAPVNGVAYVGSIYAWEGGSTLTAGGTIAPRATLFEWFPHLGDFLGETEAEGPEFYVVDFDGDGIKDIVAIAQAYWYGPNLVTPHVLVWRGGPTMTGAVPEALNLASTQLWEEFGFYNRGIFFGEVTGDGILDLIITAPSHDEPSLKHVGAVYIWHGGRIRGATPKPYATLLNPTASPYDEMGQGMFAVIRTIKVADIDHDSQDDIIVLAPFARSSVQDAGEAYWFRGPLTRTPVRPVRLGTDGLLGTKGNGTEMGY
jgi:hypothetical protein